MQTTNKVAVGTGKRARKAARIALRKGAKVLRKHGLMLGALALSAVFAVVLPLPQALVLSGGVMASVFYIQVRTDANRRQSVQEACDWHLAESHMFLDGQPFYVGAAEQAEAA